MGGGPIYGVEPLPYMGRTAIPIYGEGAPRTEGTPYIGREQGEYPLYGGTQNWGLGPDPHLWGRGRAPYIEGRGGDRDTHIWDTGGRDTPYMGEGWGQGSPPCGTGVGTPYMDPETGSGDPIYGGGDPICGRGGPQKGGGARDPEAGGGGYTPYMGRGPHVRERGPQKGGGAGGVPGGPLCPARGRGAGGGTTFPIVPRAPPRAPPRGREPVPLCWQPPRVRSGAERARPRVNQWGSPGGRIDPGRPELGAPGRPRPAQPGPAPPFPRRVSAIDFLSPRRAGGLAGGRAGEGTGPGRRGWRDGDRARGESERGEMETGGWRDRDAGMERGRRQRAGDGDDGGMETAGDGEGR